ncbi:MAG: hypothetical protein QXT10_05240 [Candidatus Bathyarchaeia archaeon]
MSFQELAITIRAVNLASAEFARVSADAARMTSEISGQTVTVRAENLASSEFIRAGEDSRIAAMGFREVSMEANVMGESVRASAPAFTEAASHAEAATISFRTAASAFSSIARLGVGIVALAGELGLVDKESAKWARTMFYAFTVMGSLVRVINGLTVLTTGHSAAIVFNTAAQNANAGSSLALAVAYKVKAAAAWMATAAQNALNISYATFLALTGVGIGVILAAAAAMAYFASQMNAATASVKEYNAALSETPSAGSRLIRLGAVRNEDLLRRGVEP